MSVFDEAVAAVQAADVERVGELLRAEPHLVTRRGGDEQQSLLDHALWALLVGDWSRPPTIAPDPDGARMGVVRLLLDVGADVNGRAIHGWTPLHTAQYDGHVGATLLLLERGADPHAEVYGAGGTPLVQALFWGHHAAADALAAHDVTPRNLRVAAGLGREDLVAACFDADGALRPAAAGGRAWYRPHDAFPEWSPSGTAQEILDEALCYAVRNGRTAVLDTLLAAGARADGAPYGGGPLHWAAAQGRTDLCRVLLDRGADPSLRAQYGAQEGVTPLHCAAWMDRVDVARLLLERGADPAIEDRTHGGTPLGWARHMGSARVAELLDG